MFCKKYIYNRGLGTKLPLKVYPLPYPKYEGNELVNFCLININYPTFITRTFISSNNLLLFKSYDHVKPPHFWEGENLIQSNIKFDMNTIIYV